MPFTPSRRTIDRAGSILRDWWLADEPELEAEVADALHLVWEFRRTFRVPLQKVTVGVRQFVQRESTAVLVSQRLKRIPTIIDKLTRLPNMKITRMQDIGGCRAILPGGRREIDGVVRRMQKNQWTIVNVRDYISNPKDTGYRAMHVVVRRDDRPIEIQLRTPNQHGWAANVERVGSMLNVNLKDGVRPPDLVEFFRVLGDTLAFQDQGVRPDEGHMVRFAALFEHVRRQYPDLFPARPPVQ